MYKKCNLIAIIFMGIISMGSYANDTWDDKTYGESCTIVGESLVLDYLIPSKSMPLVKKTFSFSSTGVTFREDKKMSYAKKYQDLVKVLFRNDRKLDVVLKDSIFNTTETIVIHPECALLLKKFLSAHGASDLIQDETQ